MTLVEEKAKKYDELLELARKSKYVAIVNKDNITFLGKKLELAQPEEPGFKVPMCKIEATTILEYDHGNPKTVCNRNSCWRIT